MVKKQVKKSEFANMSGVSAAAVTKACKTLLKKAYDGKKLINANHPDAIAYLKSKELLQTESPATGIDPLYEEAIKICKEKNRYSVAGIQRDLKIGYERAKAISQMMTAAGVVPIIPDGKKEEHQQIETTKPTPEQKPHIRGHTAKNEAKKKAAQDDDEIIDIPEEIEEFADYTLRELIEKFGTDTRFVDWLKATKSIEDIQEKRIKNAENAGKLISREIVKTGIIDTLDGAFTRMLTDGSKTIAVRSHALIKAGAEVMDIEDLIAKQLGTFIRPTKSKIARVLRNA